MIWNFGWGSAWNHWPLASTEFSILGCRSELTLGLAGEERRRFLARTEQTISIV
jgi:hypothetical protein